MTSTFTLGVIDATDADIPVSAIFQRLSVRHRGRRWYARPVAVLSRTWLNPNVVSNHPFF